MEMSPISHIPQASGRRRGSAASRSSIRRVQTSSTQTYLLVVESSGQVRRYQRVESLWTGPDGQKYHLGSGWREMSGTG
jgi:hypothetical protein